MLCNVCYFLDGGKDMFYPLTARAGRVCDRCDAKCVANPDKPSKAEWQTRPTAIDHLKQAIDGGGE